MTTHPLRLYNIGKAGPGQGLHEFVRYSIISGDATVKLYDLHEAAAYLGVTENTIKNYLRVGQLQALRKVGRSWVFTQEALDACQAIPRRGGGRRKRPKDTDDGPSDPR